MNEPDADILERRVLALTPTIKDGLASKSILESNGIPVFICNDLKQIPQEAARGAGALLITEEALISDNDGYIRQFVDNQPPWSDLPLIVLTPSGPEHPRASRVFETFSNVTLVKRPVELSVFISTVRAALRDRRRQQEVRLHLATLTRQAEDLRRSEEALREADRRKDEFLAMLAHELRNPLAAIGNAVHLATRTEEKRYVDWSMDVIGRQIKHLSRLIDDLMDVSRITRGKIRLQTSTLDLSLVLYSAVNTVRPLIEERKHTLTLDIERGSLWVNVDPTRIEQVLVNLLNNAAKYSENAGHIHLSAHESANENEIVVTIKDEGFGFEPDKLPAMFELFAQGDRSLARSEGGLGIGLTIVKKLVEMHGGSITAKSEGPGKGSQFVMRLPLANRPASKPTSISAAASDQSRKLRILAVDDDEDTVKGMATFLSIMGHDVSVAYNGPEAVMAARTLHPEFILLDIGLPGTDGYEVAAQLKKEGHCREAVFVAISGYGQEDDRRRAKESGFDFHLTKPLDHDSLLELFVSSGNGKNKKRAISKE